MQCFEFNIQHIPGNTNTLADSSSRLYEETTDEVTLEEYADGLESTTKKQFSDEYLNTVSFQTNEEIQQQLDNDPRHTSYPHKPSVKREISEIPHVMAQKQRCTPGRHWTDCRSREGCPYHGFGTFVTHSVYMDEERYLQQFEENDEADTARQPDEPGLTTMRVHVPRVPPINNIRGTRVPKEVSPSFRELSEISPEAFFKDGVQLDDDGFPAIKTKWSPNPRTTTTEES